ncbi:MAG TPA: L,D-transpeptidase family protein [Acetobacteraceae bacterium]|nr:L,D-transpeptidase family protein [Acetobacteraceae bacterium]
MEAVVGPEGRIAFQGNVYRAAIGRGGVRVAKQEGDGATPAGLLPLRRLLYRADRIMPPRVAVPREPIAPDDGWCDDPAHPDYNRQIRLPHPARHEELWRADPLYDLVGVLGWNDRPVERCRGSAIFLHVATPDYAPTAGCIALALPDLRALLDGGMTAIRVVG